MFESIAWYAPAVAGAIYLLTPFVVHNSFRLVARCRIEATPLDHLPKEISAEIRRRISEFANLGFELVGTFDCGALTNETHSYVAYFCNHTTNEFANVTAMVTLEGSASYFEFSSRFSNGRSIETNTNGILPLMPANPEIRVFRFASVEEPRTLLQLHRQLTEKYAPGLCALGEPREPEIQRTDSQTPCLRRSTVQPTEHFHCSVSVTSVRRVSDGLDSPRPFLSSGNLILNFFAFS